MRLKRCITVAESPLGIITTVWIYAEVFWGLLDNFSEHVLDIFAPQWQIWLSDFPFFQRLDHCILF